LDNAINYAIDEKYKNYQLFIANQVIKSNNIKPNLVIAVANYIVEA
jgi:hypothetical protein